MAHARTNRADTPAENHARGNASGRRSRSPDLLRGLYHCGSGGRCELPRNSDFGEAETELYAGVWGFKVGARLSNPPMRCTSVVIADRHPVVLQGLTNVLSAESGFKVVACCSDGTDCIEAIRSLVPDIAILDISLPGLTGLEILTIANFESLPTRLVFFTASVEDRELIVSAAAGAYGVILKDVAVGILVTALRGSAGGPRVFPL